MFDIIYCLSYFDSNYPNFQMYKNKAIPYYTAMCDICQIILKKEATEEKVKGESMPTVNKIVLHERKRGITPTLQPSEKEERINNNVGAAGFFPDINNDLLLDACEFWKMRKEPRCF